ncbi:disease resistance protein RML1A-like [Rutidosis leptorrhynchoides]|uniref:disease resistance protein RML1A-like n=1 Tax=Rutidosis leptorrhynchoides TaxID=125765 RepID=UPI003A99DA05
MASSSNMALPRANGSIYDVFLSFRGIDTRYGFTDHLNDALKLAGILTFRDSDDAERGEKLKPEIEKAIESSDASIIVLSENYATSTWCLDELSLILDQMGDKHFVLPVFYKVDPSDVGNLRGSFMIETKSFGRWTEDNVNKWKAALTEVASVIGMHLDGSETKFIKEIVNSIYKRLDRKQIFVSPNVKGMDARCEKICNSWLREPSEAEFVAIHGMPGSGKSTLAQFIVYSYGQCYESYSIVENIGTRCKELHGMALLQQQLCRDISKGKHTKLIHNVCQGTAEIEMLLAMTKALIVLDDIVKEHQLEDLLGSGIINKESKIIITADNDISSWITSSSKRCKEYKMELLSPDESLELLSHHAFRSKFPKDGYNELAHLVVHYCGGNPLALRVLGSSLSRLNTIASWESELSLLERDFNEDIYNVLKKGYDSLPESEKQLFLHIACFFVSEDVDYVVKILESDYARIEALIKRSFLYITAENKIMMHRLLKGMGRSVVDRESPTVAERSRVWRNKDSYNILRGKKSSKAKGLALDYRKLIEEGAINKTELPTDALQQMDELRLLKLNFVKFKGSYEGLTEDLVWLSWVGFNESTIHSEIFMGNMVALDMSSSCLNEFEPPTVLRSLKFLDLKESHNLLRIHNIDRMPNLEKMILWNCDSLFHVCRTIVNLERLAILNMTGCLKLNKMEQRHTTVDIEASTSGLESTEEPSFHLPKLLQTLFLDECNLESADNFPLSFNDQSSLQYVKLGSGLFEDLPIYSHLENLLVLDLRNCTRLKRLVCLPIRLAELFIYDCTSLEIITFQSGLFTLQKFGYEGCINLSEVQGFVKLLLVSKIDENDLGHLIWVKEYQNHEVCLVGDYELTKGRSRYIQMLYEFDINIMSTSLPDIKHPKLTPGYTSQSTTLSFSVPSSPRNSSLKGLNVTFRYTISGEDMVWSARISMTNGNDLIYSPKVFGKPESGEVGIWLSYWPIGNSLKVEDEVIVSIAVISGLEILECGASLVYTNEGVGREISEINSRWEDSFGRDLSRFQLSNGSYFLCQRDFYKLMEIGRLSLGWLSFLVGDTIDDAEVRGWRMTGRPQQSYQSFTGLKTGSFIVNNSGKKMGTDVAEVVEKLPSPHDIKVHRVMCTELMKLVDRVDRIFPEIEAARPQCSFGIKELVILNGAIDKAKMLIRDCCESSKLYLALTGNTVLSRCKKSKNLLEQGLTQIQNMVPVILESKISKIISELRLAKFSLDTSEEEAGKAVRAILEGYRNVNQLEKENNIEYIRIAAQKLQLTSHRSLLSERRSIKKLLKQIGEENNKQPKKQILLFLLDLLNKYTKSLTSGCVDNDTVVQSQDYNSSEVDFYVDREQDPPEEFKCSSSNV